MADLIGKDRDRWLWLILSFWNDGSAFWRWGSLFLRRWLGGAEQCLRVLDTILSNKFLLILSSIQLNFFVLPIIRPRDIGVSRTIVPGFGKSGGSTSDSEALPRSHSVHEIFITEMLIFLLFQLLLEFFLGRIVNINYTSWTGYGSLSLFSDLLDFLNLIFD